VANYDGSYSTGQGYKAWGEKRYPAGPSPLPTTFRYTGQRESSGIGLYWYGSRYYDSYLNRWISPDSIIPDPSNVQSFDRYAYSNNNPLVYIDPTGHDPWNVFGEFMTGMMFELGRTLAWMSPQAQDALSVKSSESTASLAGRVTGDIVSTGIGVSEVVAGVGIGTGGTFVACGTTMCIGAVATVGGGAAAATLGATTALAGSAGLGNNLARLTGKGDPGSNSPSNEWNSKKPFEGIVHNPDGTTTEYINRKSPGADGGWSRMVITRDANGNVISVTHEAWGGTSDPRVDPPDHTDEKPVDKK